MSLEEKELKKILNREKVESVEIEKYGLFITTEDHEIKVISSMGGLSILKVKDREFIE